MDERSEGEIGPADDGSDESVGEVLAQGAAGKLIGKPLEPSARSRYGPASAARNTNRSATSKPGMIGGKSASKSKYEGGGGGTSYDYLEDLEDSSQLPPPSSLRTGDIDINRGPIRDSTEEPLPK